MSDSSYLYFASSNKHKFQEAKSILNEFEIKLRFFHCGSGNNKKQLFEIQSDSIMKIAKQKSIDAFSLCEQPVIVEDAGLFIDSLSGFPGPYSSFVFSCIGNEGILKLLEEKKDRTAKFLSVIVYCDKNIKEPKIFKGRTIGRISNTIHGTKGWGYDPIFIPGNDDGKSKTYSTIQNKNKISHRYKSLQKFALWWRNKQHLASDAE